VAGSSNFGGSQGASFTPIAGAGLRDRRDHPPGEGVGTFLVRASLTNGVADAQRPRATLPRPFGLGPLGYSGCPKPVIVLHQLAARITGTRSQPEAGVRLLGLRSGT
jgi:hypothetical protein